ncbi:MULTISPECIES: EthD family reductase [unclassified Novosphingobium]|uniref:EthD family reductase n=1 Tax=unclassified Novosphingobium TaxID=2644732 RepID=UPI001446C51D|nr:MULTISPECIES: EthD family reductase [unclassified Novosphingobium]NKJ42956.1 uncharacterized protein (TIGR02118 family) [Novosphingobium sp. SG720]NMN07325.1 uncharacterized protein (TIGR02118 family) [Novosphingobium sp. SG919]NMN89634.1 uncharacterized protein (TIGR02118 family) [Novosphingobium sp. SG916]
MATLIVSYPAQEGARFDTAYYTGTHIPLVERLWTAHGFTQAEVLFPAGEQPWKAAVLLRFASQAAIDAALASPDTPEILGDVANFTDIAPVIYRAGD